MSRQASVIAAALLGLLVALEFGCADSTPGAVTESGASVLPSAAASPARTDWRTTRVASTAARAQVCGIAFDAAKLRASYLAFEAQPGRDAAQLAAVEKNYDATFNMVAKQAAASQRCSAKDKKDVDARLQRYGAGIFASGEGSGQDKPFDNRAFWKDQDDN